MTKAYYNEHDPFAAQWLRNLIAEGLVAAGDVDERDIQQVQPHELDGYTQVHFFAGIGGWSLALRLAGWPDDRPIWTGSCPCQPFSCAGKGEGENDPRHLWPDMRRLVTECRPAVVAGEQVASRDGREWLAGVRADLEALGYAVGAADLCAAGQTAPHIRQRLFWVADAERSQQGSRESGVEGQAGGRGDRPSDDSAVGGVGDGEQSRLEGYGGHGDDGNKPGRLDAHAAGPVAAAGDAGWPDFRIIYCRDGKYRRISSEPGSFPLAHGIPVKLGPMLARLEGMGRGAIKAARSNRVGRLKGYGNAIVPEVAAEFIQAFMEQAPARCGGPGAVAERRRAGQEQQEA